LFEEMGVRYLGPIDGHDLPLVISTLQFAKTCREPIVIHILTKKGKGFEAATKFPEKFHGLGPYDVNTGDTPAAKPGAAPMWQDVMGKTMVKMCRKDNTIVGITAAMPSGTGLKHLEREVPDKYYDVASRRNTRLFSRLAWPRWAFIQCAQFIRVFSSAPTIASIMTCACRICR